MQPVDNGARLLGWRRPVRRSTLDRKTADLGKAVVQKTIGSKDITKIVKKPEIEHIYYWLFWHSTFFMLIRRVNNKQGRIPCNGVAYYSPVVCVLGLNMLALVK